MSLQKVVSNYYTDLLDFLSTKYRKYGDLETYLNSIESDQRNELINKMSMVYQKLDKLQVVQEKYFQNRIKRNSVFIALFAIMMVVSLVIFVFIFFYELKDGELLTFYSKFMRGMLFFVIYFIIFTIFLLIIVNLSEGIKRYKSQRDEASTDLEGMKKLLNIPIELQGVLTFVGYLNTGSSVAANNFFQLNACSIGEYVSKASNNVYASCQDGKASGKKPKIKISTIEFDFKGFFDKNKIVLLDALNSFYDDGRGYVDVKKELIGSSNILIMKEFNRLMKFYYNIIIRKLNVPLTSDENKIHTILDKFVISDLILSTRILKPVSGTETYSFDMTTIPFNEQLKKEITEGNGISPNASTVRTRLLNWYASVNKDINNNLNDSYFASEFSNLVLAMCYLIIYLYQIEILQKSSEPNFNVALKLVMPQNIDDDITQKSGQFRRYIKNYFKEHANTELDGLIGEAKEIKAKGSTLDTMYNKVILQMKDLFDYMYQITMISVVEGTTFYFPFDSGYMTTRVLSDLESIMKGVSVDGFTLYSDEMMKKIAKELIPACRKTYIATNDIDTKKIGIISRIVSNMSKFDIPLVQYEEYIIAKIEKEVKVEPEQTVFINEILLSVDRDITLLKQGTKGKVDANNARFLEYEKFNEELDKISYNDLKAGLNVVFFTEILNKFYFNVSDSVSTNNRSNKDIYFKENKRRTLRKILFYCVLVIIILLESMHSAWWFRRWGLLGQARAIDLHPDVVKEMESDDVRIIEKEYRNEKVNMFMKLFIPIAFNVFLICLFYSLIQKQNKKEEFNRMTIDNNTAQFRAGMNDLVILLEDLDSKVTVSKRNKKIKDLGVIGVEEKTKLYETLKSIIDKFEKCNYVLAAQKDNFPFPYSEIIVDGFMVITIALCILYLISTIGPVNRFKEIKLLNRLKEKGEYLDSDYAFLEDLIARASCHDIEIDAIMFSLKIMFFLFVVFFLLFYASKVISSTDEFEYGVYNSVYFEESICLD